MPIITLNLPRIYLKDIQLLLDAGIYPNRSEFVRKAIREYLFEEFTNTLDLDPINLEQLLKERGYKSWQI